MSRAVTVKSSFVFSPAGLVFPASAVASVSASRSCAENPTVTPTAGHLPNRMQWAIAAARRLLSTSSAGFLMVQLWGVFSGPLGGARASGIRWVVQMAISAECAHGFCAACRYEDCGCLCHLIDLDNSCVDFDPGLEEESGDW
jgi:hypothetical protein